MPAPLWHPQHCCLLFSCRYTSIIMSRLNLSSHHLHSWRIYYYVMLLHYVLCYSWSFSSFLLRWPTNGAQSPYLPPYRLLSCSLSVVHLLPWHPYGLSCATLFWHSLMLCTVHVPICVSLHPIFWFWGLKLYASDRPVWGLCYPATASLSTLWLSYVPMLPTRGDAYSWRCLLLAILTFAMLPSYTLLLAILMPLAIFTSWLCCLWYSLPTLGAVYSYLALYLLVYPCSTVTHSQD